MRRHGKTRGDEETSHCAELDEEFRYDHSQYLAFRRYPPSNL